MPRVRTRVIARAALVALALLAGLALLLWGFSGVSVDAACTSCHRTTGSPVVAGHASLPCYACHAAPTVDGYLAAKANEPGMVVAALAGRDATGTATTPSRTACLECHEGVLMTMVERDGLRIDHGTCADPPQTCSDCHWGSGHASSTRPGRGIAMDRCLECHDDITASWDCDTCHLGSGHGDRPSVGSWAVTHGPKWESTHGMGDTSTCGACHAKTRCAKCHGVELPHPAAYVNGKHGEEAKPDPGRCVTCHRQTFCDGCHGIEMPHPEGFLPGHSAIVKSSGDEGCARCHMLEDCGVCHESHVHPGHR